MSEIKVSKIKGKTGVNGGKPNIASPITINGLSLDSAYGALGEGTILNRAIINSNTLPDSAEVERGNFWYNDSGATPTLSMLVDPEKNRWIKIADAQSAGSGVWYGDRAVHSKYNDSPGQMYYWSLTTHAAAVTFGYTISNTSQHSSVSNQTYGLFAGFQNPNSLSIEYITISTPGDATDFGDLTVGRGQMGSCSNGDRGCFAGASSSNVIDYVTIDTPGNAIDFGDLTVARYFSAGCADATRGIFGGGWSSAWENTIDYITIDTPSNATDFGDLTVGRGAFGACSDPTYGVFVAGLASSNTDVLDYVTIQTPGNATDFGDYYGGIRKYNNAVSNGTNGFGYGGEHAGGANGVIATFTIDTPANATLYGYMGHNGNYMDGCSGNSA